MVRFKTAKVAYAEDGPSAGLLEVSSFQIFHQISYPCNETSDTLFSALSENWVNDRRKNVRPGSGNFLSQFFACPMILIVNYVYVFLRRRNESIRGILVNLFV